MTATVLLLYFLGLVALSGVALGGIYLLRRRLSFGWRTALFLVFYVIARYTLRLVPAGVVPFVAETPLFYALLAVVLVVACWFYVTRIEEMTWKEAGWEVPRSGAWVLWAVGSVVAGVVPLLVMSALSHPLKANGLKLTPGMLVVAVSFGLVLAGFFEETIFRGVIQTKLPAQLSAIQANLLQATLFSASHLFYFPFDKHAAFYFFTFLMGWAAGYLRSKFSSLWPAAVMHAALVVATVLAPAWMFGFLFKR